MNRSRLTAVGVALGLAASALPAAGAAPRVVSAGSARFPDRLFVLSSATPSALQAGNVVVRENGTPIDQVEVTPVRDATLGQLGVVLVLDASLSMRGRPIADAVLAARAFVAKRTPNEEIAVVAFSDRPRLVQPFTTDALKLKRSLATVPKLSEGTHIYDAVGSGLKLLYAARVNAGAVVLLSDGSDTGSSRSLTHVAAAARRAHVRIFTVGLRSTSFKPGNLQSLASATNGSFTQAANSHDLTDIYAALSTRLANEYLLSYRSPARPGEKISVTVTVNGTPGAAVVSYDTPPLPSKPTGPFYPSARARFWKSIAATIVMALLAAALVGFGFALVFRPRARTLRARLGHFVSMPVDDTRAPRSQPNRLSRPGNETAHRQAHWERFKRDVELADITLPPSRIALWTALATVLAGFLLVQAVGSPVAALVAVAVPLSVISAVRRRVRKKRQLFAEQLPDTLQVLASALRAGHSLVGALSVVVDDADEPARSEFQRIVADERLGVPLEDALEVVVERMDSKELSQVALVASLQRRTGGNSAEVLDRVVQTIRERAELRRLVKTLTAQGRTSRWVVTALPLGLLAVITLINPSYVAPLIHTGGGRLALLAAAIMVTAGSMVIQRIVDIKV